MWKRLFNLEKVHVSSNEPSRFMTYFEDSCIIHLMYLEVRDSSYVLEIFVNLCIMIIMVALW